MLSICIPIYNFDVTQLVNRLNEQLLAAECAFEILLMDDASEESFRNINSRLISDVISYIQLAENIGRSKIRNRLAEASQYSYLIFMDCDSSLPSSDYIKNYLPYCNPQIVCYGGRIYESDKPSEDVYLRWKYGVERESAPAKIREKNPNYSFCTNNFLIDRNVFEQVLFNEDLKGYGHEDTFFGLELLDKEIIIKHIDNPLVHIGLESASEFLAKTENAVQNLSEIDKILHKKYPQYVNHSRLIRTYLELRKFGLKSLFNFFFKAVKQILRKNLLGKNPSLRVFDIYKLGILCSEK